MLVDLAVVLVLLEVLGQATLRLLHQLRDLQVVPQQIVPM
jgi:hypothetical protein